MLPGEARISRAPAMGVAPRPPADCPWYLQPFLWHQKRKYGAVLQAALVWARVPRLFLGVALLYGMIDRRSSPLEAALRSLVSLRVAQINGCPFCVDLNAVGVLRRGTAGDKLAALAVWRDSALFDDRERAALGYAEAVTRSEVRVDETLMGRLRDHFDDDAIVELTALIAFQNLSSKFNSALGVPAQGLCPLPAAPRADGARSGTPGGG